MKIRGKVKPYGMGPPKLADTLSISFEEAENLFKEYAEAFPTLNKWLDDLGNFAVKNHYSETFAPCRRKRWYPDMKKILTLKTEAKNLRGTLRYKEIWKEIFKIEGQTRRNGGNQPIQGSGADICKEALVEVRNLIEKYNKLTRETKGKDVAYLICTVHDAIDVEVDEYLAPIIAADMERIMVECGNKYVKQVQMEVDTTITDYWTK